MMFKSKKTPKGKWNILIMKDKGEVTTLVISPAVLLMAAVFALLLTAAAVVGLNLYFSLYLDYSDLRSAHQETAEKLAKLDSRHKYQISLAQDYADLMNELNGEASPSAPPAGPAEAPPAAGPEAADAPDSDPLTAWADAWPDPSDQTGEKLAVENFSVDGHRFSFTLVNETSGSLARGHLLALFLVEADGRTTAAPFPDFDHLAPDPDFSLGPSYTIRSSKIVSGQLKAPAGGEITAVMVVARANDGRIVMKQRVGL